MLIHLRKLKLIGVIIFVLVSLSIIRINTKAQEDTSGLSISPVVFELNSDPGDFLTNQIKIHNPSEFPQNVKITVEDFVPIGEEGEVALSESDGENSTFSLASWTTVSPAEFTLQSKQQQIINFSINVPSNGEPGGHYGSIVAGISGGSNDFTGSSVGNKRGALILLRVSGNIKEEIIVNDFDTKSFQEFGPVEFSVKFENIGNVHVKPAGFVIVTNMFGKEVAQFEIPQNNVIPGAIRQANANWEDKNLIGRYTATLVANYGSTSKQSVTAITNFTVFPWKKGLLYGGIGLFALYLLMKSRKRLGKALKVLAGGQ